MKYKELIKLLKSMSNPNNADGMQRFGIRGGEILGISLPQLRKIAKDIKKDHPLALRLWDSKIHEAMLLACFIAEAEKVTENLMEKWAKDFDSWDIVDQCCSNLLDKTPFVEKKIDEWTKRDEEFVKRAGFVLMCAKAVHDKKAKDEEFERYFPIIKREANDERNFVKKAVNWALRQIGKRNMYLNEKAVKTAKEIEKMDSRAARWIAKDALRELNNEKTLKRIKK